MKGIHTTGPLCLVLGIAMALATPATAAGLKPLQAIGIKLGCPFYAQDALLHNAGYVDTAAYYGVAQVPLSLPDGASIRIEGRFPKTRYFSLQAYDGAKSGNLTDVLPDARIVPTTGAALNPNPAALPDSAGYTNQYRLTLRYSNPPADPAAREPNTLYVGAPASATATRTSKQIFYRTYLPNPGSDNSGDTPFPKLFYSGPGGDIDFENTSDVIQCAALKTTGGVVTTIPRPLVPQRKNFFRALPNAQSAGLYLNGDSNYLYAATSKTYSPLVVIRTRSFAVPRLPDQTPTGVEPDVRYWSICHYDLGTGIVLSCLADRDAVSQPDGYNMIVLSSSAIRPALATAGNGYNWLDTMATLGEELVMRQLIARPGFSGDYGYAQAQPKATVEATLGDWAPEVTYCAPAVFDATAASGGAALFKACHDDFYKTR